MAPRGYPQFVLITTCYQCNQIKNEEEGWGMYHDWEMRDMDEMIILERKVNKSDGEFVDWIYLLQDKHKWTAVANTETKFRVP